MNKRFSIENLVDIASRYTLIALTIVLFGFFAVAETETFLTVRNLQSVAATNVVVALLALGIIFPLIVGEFDLSVGYTLGVAQALAVGLMSKSGWGIPMTLIVVAVVTSLIGLIVGVVVASTEIHSLIVTLAVGSLLGGLTQWYTGGSVIFENVPAVYGSIARNDVFGVPLPIIYLLVVVGICLLMLERAPFGRRMYATGGNRAAAVLVGIRVRPLIIISFGVSGLLAGLAGIVISSRLASAQPGLGPDFLLPAYAAAFLGATVIRPGRFNPLGVVIAVYLLGIATNGLGLMGVPAWAESVFNGFALLAAVWVSLRVAEFKRTRTERRYRESVTSASVVPEIVSADSEAPLDISAP